MTYLEVEKEKKGGKDGEKKKFAHDPTDIGQPHDTVPGGIDWEPKEGNTF